MTLLQTFLLIGLAGGLGALIRFGLGLVTGVIPWGILIANCVGSFIAGAVIAGDLATPWLIAGLAGGISTFSTFAAQTHELLVKAKPLRALQNIALNLLLPAACLLVALILL
jgi:fluoride exporter